MSPGVALLNGEMIKTADATWFDNGLKISIIGTPGDANYRYHSKARKTICGMGTFCLIGMISFQLTMQNNNLTE